MGQAKAIIDGSAVRAPTSASEGLRIEDRPIGDLIPYARNARTHSPAQVALIAGSIREAALLIDMRSPDQESSPVGDSRGVERSPPSPSCPSSVTANHQDRLAEAEAITAGPAERPRFSLI